MSLKKHIPNFVTLLNLFSGCIAIIFVVNGNYLWASVFVFLGIFFDFFDGLLARKLDVQSPLGIQLDSLADLVTSGVVPGIIMYKLIALSLGIDQFYTINETWGESMNWYDIELMFLPLVGLFIPMASAYRLAKFNLDEDQQTYFKGLPVPANTLLIISLPLILEFQNNDTINELIINKWALIILTLLSCYLLNSNIKLFALKFKDWSFKTNASRYIFLILAIVSLVIFKFLAIPIIIVLYIFISLLDKKNIN